MLCLTKESRQEDIVITEECEYKALKYIREKPGRVYYDELERILKTYSTTENDPDLEDNQRLMREVEIFLE